MKKLIAIAVITLFFVACGSPEESIEKKLAKKKTEYAELGKEIAELESQLAATKKDSTGVVVPVRVHTIERATFKRPVEVQGVVESDQNITVSAEVTGVLLQVLVKEGQHVSKGQTLARINGDITASSIAEVENALDLAEVTYNRTKKLYDQKVGTEIQLLQAKNRRDALQKQLSTLRSQYAKYTISAPISGIVDDVMVNQGENIMMGMPIARVVDNSQLQVKAQVSERYITAVKTGDSVYMTFSDLGATLGAKVSAVGQVISSGNRTFTITINLQNNKLGLKPNLLTMITFYDIVKPNSIAVPSNIISTEGDKNYVYTITTEKGKNVAHKIEVTRGESGNGYTLIEAGLKEGDQLVIQNNRNLLDGDNVNIIK